MILILCIRFACLLRSSPPANQLMGNAVSARAPLLETWRFLIPPACPPLRRPPRFLPRGCYFFLLFLRLVSHCSSFYRSNTDHLHIPSLPTTVVTALEAGRALPPADSSNVPQYHSLGRILIRILLSLDTHGYQESSSINCIEVHSPSGTNA